jgi:hypothetical protein
MRRFAAGLILILLTSPIAVADEGMWRPGQLPGLREPLERLGFEGDPGRLADLTGHPMGAVISLGGCTASFVSPEGLVVTNHHCAYGSIQYNSTESRNLLQTGFLAAERNDELPAAPGSRILVTVAVNDVTDEILGSLPEDATGLERWEAIATREKKLVAGCEEDAGHRCKVAVYHGGHEFELIQQLEIRDVRLVYVPAGSIGVFGGDVDNWMWPRHTGDYAFYRAYVGPDGQPADPAEENVPYRPNHYLRLASDPLGEGDFVMALGYPGSTNRYRLATEVESAFDWSYPARIRLYRKWLDILDQQTADSQELAITYASLKAGLENAVKYYRGLLDGYARSDMLKRKTETERDLRQWIEADPARHEAFLPALLELRDLVAREQGTRERRMYYEELVRRGELFRTARTLYRLAREKQKPDLEREQGYQERDLPSIREQLIRIDRTFDPDVDRAFWRHFIVDYASIAADQHVAIFDKWFGIGSDGLAEEELNRRLVEMYEATQLDEQQARLAWLDATSAEIEASDDPFLQLAVALLDSDLELEAEEKELEGLLEEVRSRYMKALISYLGTRGRQVYPDANGTLRVTFGSVQGYSPGDAVTYAPFTTLEGILEKHTGEDPFDVPAVQAEAIRQGLGDAFRYEPLGSVPVNFLSTLDSTGGNSGSATLNGKAELVGLLFDGVWESIIADWDFIPELSRSIHVDMRYVLWVMETLDGAHHLIEEMRAER